MGARAGAGARPAGWKDVHAFCTSFFTSLPHTRLEDTSAPALAFMAKRGASSRCVDAASAAAGGVKCGFGLAQDIGDNSGGFAAEHVLAGRCGTIAAWRGGDLRAWLAATYGRRWYRETLPPRRRRRDCCGATENCLLLPYARWWYPSEYRTGDPRRRARLSLRLYCACLLPAPLQLPAGVRRGVTTLARRTRTLRARMFTLAFSLLSPHRRAASHHYCRLHFAWRTVLQLIAFAHGTWRDSASQPGRAAQQACCFPRCAAAFEGGDGRMALCVVWRISCIAAFFFTRFTFCLLLLHSCVQHLLRTAPVSSVWALCPWSARISGALLPRAEEEGRGCRREEEGSFAHAGLCFLHLVSC